MTSRTFKVGNHTCKAYKKSAGKGWEVGLSFAGKTVFTGNFVHTKEANTWFTKMNMEARKFCKRYTLPHGASTTFFTRFMENHMHKMYYSYVNREISRHQRGCTQALKKYQRKYTHMSRAA